MTPEEKARLEALWAYDILDTPAEEDFDEIVELASVICGVPISLITLIDETREFRKAKFGIEGQNTPREYTFCTHAIEQDDIMVVQDATEDDRFASNPFVVGAPNICFYAGMPLRTADGFNLGTLCVIDHQPRELDEFQISALRTLSHQVMTLIEMRHKVKELKEALKTVDEQSRKLEMLNQHNTRLLSIAGHDIRNPLAGIKSILNLVKEGLIDQDEFIGICEELDTQVDATIDLLGNLVEWGVRGRQSTINKRQLDLTVVLGEVIRNNTPLAKNKNLELILDCPEGAKLIADEDMIRFIVRNLIQNAVKFTEKGHILVTVRPLDADVAITVADTGRGMSPQVRERLFNWAARNSATGTRGETGSGLGLIMCKEFVDAHDGDILVDSKPGVGTMFTVRLPK